MIELMWKSVPLRVQHFFFLICDVIKAIKYAQLEILMMISRRDVTLRK